MKTRRPPWNLILLLWLAFALRVWRLGAQSLWYDEGYSAYLGAHLPLDRALDLTARDVVPPLYYLLLRLWVPLVGMSEYALRLLSVLFGVVAVALMGRIGRQLADAGLLSAVLATVAPVLIWLSQDARMYGPLVAWSLLAAWGLLRAVAPAAPSRSRQRGWALFVGAGLAALYTHTVAAFWLMGQVLFGLLATWQQRHQPQRIREGLLALALIAAGYLPWVIVARISYPVNLGYWPGYLPPLHLWRVAWEALVGGQYLSPVQTDLAAVWFAAVTLLGWMILLFRRRQVALYLFCYLVVSLLAMSIAFRHTPKLGPRYPTAMAPALLLILAAGATEWRGARGGEREARGERREARGGGRGAHHVSSLALLPCRGPPAVARQGQGAGPGRTGCFTFHISRLTFYILLLGVFVLSLRADVNLYFDADYGKDDWRAAARYVQAQRRPDEAVLLVSGHAFPVFAYYYGWEGWQALPDDLQLDVTHVQNYPVVAPRLNRILAGASGAWLVLWQDEVVDPTGLVPALLGDVGRELPIPTFHGSSVKVRHFELPAAVHFPEELPVEHVLHQAAAPGLAALGYTLSTPLRSGTLPTPLRSPWHLTEPRQVGTLPAAPLPADAEISLRVFWQAEEPLRGAHAASLRLSDRLGQEWARQDSLLAGPYFAERWPPGTPVMGQYTATLPLGTPPGTYTPTLMIYRGDETFGTLHLSPLVITRPLSVPTPLALELPPSSPPQAGGIEGGGSELSLVGVGFDQQTVTPCQHWSLSLAWRAETRPAQDYRLRLSAGLDQTETVLAVDYPTTRWQPGDVWRTRHRVPINCRALDGTVPVMAQLLGADGQPLGAPLNLGEITVAAGRQFALPAELTAVRDVRLAGVGTLVGYWLDQDRAQPGENLQVALYWRAGQPIDGNYSIFVHLESDADTAGRTGRVWAQHDGWPVGGQKPTSTWAPEEVIIDRHVVPIGVDVPPGLYRLVVGMYDALTLQPLAAFEPDGRPIEGGRILLQPITIYVP